VAKIKQHSITSLVLQTA